MTLRAEPESAVSWYRLGASDLPPALRPYLLEICEQAIPEAATPSRFEVTATTAPNLNITLEGRGYVRLPPQLGGRRVPLRPFALAGPMPFPVTVEIDGPVRGMDVRFRPVGPLALLGVTCYGAGPDGLPPFEQVVRADLAPRVRAWMRTLLAPLPPGASAADAFAWRAERIVTFLLECLGDVPEEVEFLRRATEVIELTEGRIGVTELADALGVSPATLRRRFACLGISAKRFSSVTRFRAALACLDATPHARLTDVALRFGYADQAHFNRDHRRFAGASPTRLADADRTFDGAFATPEAASGG